MLSALSPSQSCILEKASTPRVNAAHILSNSFCCTSGKRERHMMRNPPTCICYHIEWQVTVNNQEISMDTEEDVVLASSAFWQLSLEKKLEKALWWKTARHCWVISDDIVIVTLISDYIKCKLMKQFDDTDIMWLAIEKQLLTWSNLFSKDKELRLKISFNYVDSHHSSQSTNRKGEKKGNHPSCREWLVSETHGLMQRNIFQERSQSGAVFISGAMRLINMSTRASLLGGPNG